MPEASEPAPSSSPFETEGRRVVGLIVAVIAPVTLITALAYYFGYRREQAFAGYFGIDPNALGFTTNDYVLRSVDALFVPVTVVLLVAFGAVLLHALVPHVSDRIDLAPFAAVAGLCFLAVGIALLAGGPVAHSYGYLQALGPAVGVALLLYALAHKRSVSRRALSAAAFVGTAVVLVSLFWATAEYADTRGRDEAKRLARDITVDPSVTIFSKQNLDIDRFAPGAGLTQPVSKDARGPDGCSVIRVHRYPAGAFPFEYSGFTLLITSGGNYFLTPTSAGVRWDPAIDSVFVIPDNDNIRVELARGPDYVVNPTEQTAQGQSTLPFTC
jgi:hypothetical protein